MENVSVCRGMSLAATPTSDSSHMWYTRTSAFLASSVAGKSFAS
jgi:hypothetical protein